MSFCSELVEPCGIVCCPLQAFLYFLILRAANKKVRSDLSKLKSRKSLRTIH